MWSTKLTSNLRELEKEFYTDKQTNKNQQNQSLMQLLALFAGKRFPDSALVARAVWVL